MGLTVLFLLVLLAAALIVWLVRSAGAGAPLPPLRPTLAPSA